MADLKPCPFCGHSAALESVGADHFVMCDGCCAETARFQSPTGDNQRAIEHAVAAWNRRAASPATQVEDARDAARYRWLVERYCGWDAEWGDPAKEVFVFKVDRSAPVPMNKKELSASIDAAMSASKEGA